MYVWNWLPSSVDTSGTPTCFGHAADMSGACSKWIGNFFRLTHFQHSPDMTQGTCPFTQHMLDTLIWKRNGNGEEERKKKSWWWKRRQEELPLLLAVCLEDHAICCPSTHTPSGFTHALCYSHIVLARHLSFPNISPATGRIFSP